MVTAVSQVTQVYPGYFLAWFPIVIIAFANAAVREAGYAKYVSELAAHQISTLTLGILVAIYVWLLSNFLQIQYSAQAIGVGLLWLVMTMIFEFGFGHFVQGEPWSRLLNAYNVLEGRVWGLFLLWLAVTPYVFYKI